MRKVNCQLFDEITGKAAASPRKRMHFNFHEPNDPSQRFLNAMEPGTYLRPHRHVQAGKSEIIIVVRGRIGFLIFSGTGEILHTIIAEPSGVDVGVDLRPEDWHTLVSLQPGSVILECKAGPYVPTSAKDFATWAPKEGEPEAAAQVKAWERLFQ